MPNNTPIIMIIMAVMDAPVAPLETHAVPSAQKHPVSFKTAAPLPSHGFV